MWYNKKVLVSIPMGDQQKLNVAVLCGGLSGEREVSLRSGENVARYLSEDKYQISRIDVVSETAWHWYGQQGAERAIDTTTEADQAFLKTFDVFFNVLHGTFGEDGKLQALLDTLGLCYTGSGREASELTINKVKTMEVVVKKKMAVPEFFCVTADVDTEKLDADIKDRFGYPAIVKPNDSGSTLGLSLVQRKDGLAEALAKAALVSSEIIIQRYIFGREFTCGVLGNVTDPDLFLLPPVEIVIKNQVFDFNDKYFSKETQELCPAPIDKHFSERIQQAAMMAHRTLGCDGLSRTDFRVDGTGQLFFLETNTSPGMTAVSLCPKEAVAAGIGMPQFLDRIIDLALSKVSSK